MAKKGLKKKRVKKISKNNNLKNKMRIPVSYLVLFLFILLAILIYGLLSFPIVSRTNSIKIHSKIPLNKTKELNKLLMSPVPSKTISQTPTPVPLSGYCLRVPVLMYHHIQPEAQAKEKGQTALTVDSGFFDKQMQYLAQNGYTTLFANELIDALRNHTGLPAKPVVITIDDGYADNFINKSLFFFHGIINNICHSFIVV